MISTYCFEEKGKRINIWLKEEGDSVIVVEVRVAAGNPSKGELL